MATSTVLRKTNLPSSVCPKRDDGAVSKRQTRFANSASLKVLMSLNPSLPTDFERVSLSQATQQNFRTTGVESHQNLVKTD